MASALAYCVLDVMSQLAFNRCLQGCVRPTEVFLRFPAVDSVHRRQRALSKLGRHMLQFGRSSHAEADGNLEIRRKSRCLGISRNTAVKSETFTRILVRTMFPAYLPTGLPLLKVQRRNLKSSI